MLCHHIHNVQGKYQWRVQFCVKCSEYCPCTEHRDWIHWIKFQFVCIFIIFWTRSIFSTVKHDGPKINFVKLKLRSMLSFIGYPKIYKCRHALFSQSVICSQLLHRRCTSVHSWRKYFLIWSTRVVSWKPFQNEQYIYNIHTCIYSLDLLKLCHNWKYNVHTSSITIPVNSFPASFQQLMKHIVDLHNSPYCM